jgi:hypothetical protein
MKTFGLALVLCGCWHFGSPEPPPEPPPPLRPRPTAPVPAAIADAGVASAADLDAGLADASPGARASPPADAAPCVRARVISTTLSGSDIKLVVAAGSNSGVTRLWTGTLIGPVQTPVQIIRVDRQVTVVGVSRVTPDQIQRSPFVLLCP